MVATSRATFDRQLHTLQDETLLLGSMVEKAIELSVDALTRLDADLARRIIDDDKRINAQRYQLEETAVRLIAMQQPLAGDLRLIASVIHISTDLERMGDYAAGIAKIVVMHGDLPPVKPLIDIPRMAELSCSMLRRSLDAFVRRDVDAARSLIGEDDAVDALYDQVYRELLTFMIEDPKLIQRATWLLWAAHNVERIADRTTNICERVIYMVTGVNEDIDVSTY
ncbi:MAG TPA: phosphate signaling complex protein PhoU [Chloroflexota bacterium]|nr:phosphate signaling complex protein PhoU [Chloroflexota bacterium]